jgi:hypothetical protein
MQSRFVLLPQLSVLYMQTESCKWCAPNGVWTLYVAITGSLNKDVPNWEWFLVKQSQTWRSYVTTADLNKDLAHFPLSGKTWSAGPNYCGCRKSSLTGERASPLCSYWCIVDITNQPFSHWNWFCSDDPIKSGSWYWPKLTPAVAASNHYVLGSLQQGLPGSNLTDCLGVGFR